MTTLWLAGSIALALYCWRRRSLSIGHAWQQAKWWERAVLVIACLPIPGPFDELAGLLILRRIARRA